MLKKLFIFDASRPTVWYQVILWWEMRRWLLNLLLILFIGFFCVVSFFKYNGDPRFTFVYLVGAGYFLLWTNIFYTLGWRLHLILRLSGARVVKFVISAMFVCTLGLTFAAATFSTLTYLFFSELDQMSSSESKDPCIRKLTAPYKFTKESLSKLNLPEGFQNAASLNLSQFEDFTFNAFPSYQNSDSLTAYRLISASGKWSCKSNQNGVIIVLKFTGNVTDPKTYQTIKDFTYRDHLRVDDLQNPHLDLIVGGDENKKLVLEKVQ